MSNMPSDDAQAQKTSSLSSSSWTPLSAYEPKNIDWLWKPRFVAGRINLIAGMGDVGKDVFCCGMTACVTTGLAWPDGTPGPKPMKVGVICPEDQADDTIRPRMEAAGADVSLVRVWIQAKPPTVRDLKTLGLLIVSPLLDLMDGKKDMNREKDVRQFLQKWQEAECTVLGIVHYGKANDRAAVQKILGATGMSTFVRSAWSIQRDTDDRERRLFMRLKGNLTPDGTEGLTYRIKHVGPWDQSIRCEWDGTTDKTPDEVMREAAGSANESHKSAGRWLFAWLAQAADRRMLYGDIVEAAQDEGYSEHAIKQAKKRCKNIESVREGFGRGSRVWWQLT